MKTKNHSCTHNTYARMCVCVCVGVRVCVSACAYNHHHKLSLSFLTHSLTLQQPGSKAAKQRLPGKSLSKTNLETEHGVRHCVCVSNVMGRPPPGFLSLLTHSLTLQQSHSSAARSAHARQLVRAGPREVAVEYYVGITPQRKNSQHAARVVPFDLIGCPPATVILWQNPGNMKGR